MPCGFLLLCTGYYRYDRGYAPEFEGWSASAARSSTRQHWPEDIDYASVAVVVIGKGATAVTLVPAMAETAAHVTMLQRSPSYIVALPAEDPVARLLRRLPPRLAYAVLRWKNVLMMLLSFQLSRRRPELVKKLIRKEWSAGFPRAIRSTRISSRPTTPGTSMDARCSRRQSLRSDLSGRASAWSPTGSRR